MKKNILIIALFLVARVDNVQAQNMWIQKADVGGTGRYGAVGFSISSKGYIGTGKAGNDLMKDFWEYDPIADVWTQKANFGGIAREFAVAFSIGNKGYLGIGDLGNSQFAKDFWEYDPSNNVWTQKTNFGGTARWLAVGFSNGNKGYIGTGQDQSFQNKKDFWEYDPSANSWIQRQDFGGIARNRATGFSIGDNGYIGTGTNNPGVSALKDFWEYNPVTDAWIQKTDFSGGARDQAIGFSIGSKGYIGTGDSAFSSSKKDFWEYDPSTNSWTKKDDFGGIARSDAVGFSIGNKGYLGTGVSTEGYLKDFWNYTPDEFEVTCNIPTTFSTNIITSTTVKLKWLNINEALSYKIRFKPAGTSEWTITKSIDNHKTLHSLSPNTNYTWQVKSFCAIQPVVSSDWSEKQFFTTDALRLSEAVDDEMMFSIYPNPLSSSATVSFFLTEESNVTIELLDVNGRSLRVIAEKDFSSGTHEVIFNRESLVAGIYFLQLKTNAGVMMKKIVIE